MLNIVVRYFTMNTRPLPPVSTFTFAHNYSIFFSIRCQNLRRKTARRIFFCRWLPDNKTELACTAQVKSHSTLLLYLLMYSILVK